MWNGFARREILNSNYETRNDITYVLTSPITYTILIIMSTFTPTELRKNLYKILDTVALHGKSQEIIRNGKKLKIILADKNIDKFKNLKPHNSIIGDPEELVNIKLYEWNEPKNL